MPYGKPKYLTTVRSIPDDLWDEIELLLTSGKPNNIIGRPLIPFRKVLDRINSTCIEDRVWMKDAAKRR
jgi:hypothetical protein